MGVVDGEFLGLDDGETGEGHVAFYPGGRVFAVAAVCFGGDGEGCVWVCVRRYALQTGGWSFGTNQKKEKQ